MLLAGDQVISKALGRVLAFGPPWPWSGQLVRTRPVDHVAPFSCWLTVCRQQYEGIGHSMLHVSEVQTLPAWDFQAGFSRASQQPAWCRLGSVWSRRWHLARVEYNVPLSGIDDTLRLVLRNAGGPPVPRKTCCILTSPRDLVSAARVRSSATVSAFWASVRRTRSRRKPPMAEDRAAGFYAKMATPEPPKAEGVLGAARAPRRGFPVFRPIFQPECFAQCGGSWRGRRNNCGENRRAGGGDGAEPALSEQGHVALRTFE
jgi:hypothetical protein